MGALTRLGLVLIAAGVISALSIGLAAWSYKRSLRADLNHVLFLEKEIAARDLQIEDLKSKLPLSDESKIDVKNGIESSFVFLPESAPRSVTLERFALSWSGSRLRARFTMNNQQADAEASIRVFAFAQLKNGLWIEPSSAVHIEGTSLLFDIKSIPSETISSLKSSQVMLGPFANRSDIVQVGVYLFDDQMRVIASALETPPKYVPRRPPPPPKPEPTLQETTVNAPSETTSSNEEEDESEE